MMLKSSASRSVPNIINGLSLPSTVSSLSLSLFLSACLSVCLSVSLCPCLCHYISCPAIVPARVVSACVTPQAAAEQARQAQVCPAVMS